jgi:hypothetical protein
MFVGGWGGREPGERWTTAAPKSAPQRINYRKKNAHDKRKTFIAPPCLGEALRRGRLVKLEKGFPYPEFAIGNPEHKSAAPFLF